MHIVHHTSPYAYISCTRRLCGNPRRTSHADACAQASRCSRGMIESLSHSYRNAILGERCNLHLHEFHVSIYMSRVRTNLCIFSANNGCIRQPQRFGTDPSYAKSYGGGTAEMLSMSQAQIVVCMPLQLSGFPINIQLQNGTRAAAAK